MSNYFLLLVVFFYLYSFFSSKWFARSSSNLSRVPSVPLYLVAVHYISSLASFCCAKDLIEIDDSTSEASELSAAKQGSKKKEYSVLEKMFGETLYIIGYETNEQGKEQKVVFEASLNDLVKDARVIGVYFSASWCAPCRQFTPVLAKFYEEMKKKKAGLEILWISRDQTSEDFLQYFSKMPWLAVPMQNAQSVYESLAPQYNVKGIPSLVFIDAKTGEVITLDGRTQVLKDPYGLQFPWKSRSLLNLVPSSLKDLLRTTFGSLRQRLLNVLSSLLQGFLPKRIRQRLFQ